MIRARLKCSVCGRYRTVHLASRVSWKSRVDTIFSCSGDGIELCGARSWILIWSRKVRNEQNPAHDAGIMARFND